MKQAHRDNIRANLVRLVEGTSLDKLIPKLLEKGVFSERMKEKYMSVNGVSRDITVDLYLDMQRRGPDAYQKLIEALRESGHNNLVDILSNGNTSTSSTWTGETTTSNGSELQNNYNELARHTIPVCLPKYLTDENETLPLHLRELAIAHPNSTFNLRTEPINVVVRKGDNRMDINHKSNLQRYIMGSKPKGYFLMINNIDFINGVHEKRVGSEIDEVNLKKLFDGLGYSVLSWRNQTHREMKDIIKRFATMKEHKQVDSCVVAILSHGNSNENYSYIISTDCQPLSIEWVIDCFSNRNAPDLADKPKVFLFQSCRGEHEDYGVKLSDSMKRISTDGTSNIHRRTYSDILIAYSTIPGYVSHRDLYRGTWFIETICETFMTHSHNTDIENMLKMVDNKLRTLISDQSTMQTTCYENRGFQTFYFNPGLYDENTTEELV